MMKDFNNNCRTLIVCFVIALVFLVPLRFMEFSNQISEMSSTQVLGVKTVTEKEVVLPNAELEDKETVFFEAPYNEIDGLEISE